MFKINEINFKIDIKNSHVKFKDNTIDIEINGDEETFESISESEDSDWNWALYPPKFYVECMPIKNKNNFEINLTNGLLSKFSFALYMMDHYPIEGKLKILNNELSFYGNSDVGGKIYPIEIKLKLKV